jgi:hypothetical protein
MSNALVVDGNKVLVEMEWEQIDGIVRQELREHIIMTEREKGGRWVHPDDEEHNKILLPALYTVYEYYAGQEAVNELREQLNETVRSAE